MLQRVLQTLRTFCAGGVATEDGHLFEPLEPRLMLSLSVHGPLPALPPDAPPDGLAAIIVADQHETALHRGANVHHHRYQCLSRRLMPAVLLAKPGVLVVLDSSQRSFAFDDADGDRVTVKLDGSGQVEIQLDSTFTETDSADIFSINMQDTAANTSLTVNVVKHGEGSGKTTIDRLLSHGSVKSLKLNHVIVNGMGVKIDGSLQQFTADSLANGADFWIQQAGTRSVTIDLGSVWGSRDDQVVVSIAGAAGRIHIDGGLSQALIATSGNVDDFAVGDNMHDALMLAGTTLGEGFVLQGGVFDAAIIKSAQVGGDMIDSIIAAGGDPGADGLFEDGEVVPGGLIKTLKVGGVIVGAQSPHINPGIYAAKLDRVTVNGINLIKEAISGGLGVLGSAVIDPLPLPGNALDADDVKDIIERAIAQATLLGVNATISVVDREGNFLGAVRMTDGSLAPAALWATLEAGGVGGLEAIEADDPFAASFDLPGGRIVPTSLVATTKAGTAAFLSTDDGNAFTTRTAGQIIQSHFPPGVKNQDGGPLFGVQLSSLPTSDVNGLPLGLSADPGGVPLYRGGQLVGGIGIEVDGQYTVDPSFIGGSTTVEERIALAGQSSLEPPGNIRADHVFIDGIRLDYSNGSTPLIASLGTLPDYDTLAAGPLLDELIAPAASSASKFSIAMLVDPDDPTRVIAGEVPDASAGGVGLQDFFTGGSFDFIAGVDGFASDGSTVGGSGLTTGDVERILFQAHELITFDRLRAQVRRDSPQLAQVTVSVVDVNGNLLGSFRTLDAPVFGYDVSVQKARTAAFFSRPDAGAQLTALDGELATVLDVLDDAFTAGEQLINSLTPYDTHVDAAAAFGVDLDGSVAVADRTGGFLSRPNLPDGIRGAGPGPFSALGPDEFSPFNTGLQTVLMIPELVDFLVAIEGAGTEATALGMLNVGTLGGGGAVPVDGVGGILPTNNGGDGLPGNSLANGMQIFAGSVPLYKDGALVGGVGVSGDGIEQDDFISFRGATGYQDFGAGVTRADGVFISGGTRLPYIKLPRSPFAGV